MSHQILLGNFGQTILFVHSKNSKQKACDEIERRVTEINSTNTYPIAQDSFLFHKIYRNSASKISIQLNIFQLNCWFYALAGVSLGWPQTNIGFLTLTVLHSGVHCAGNYFLFGVDEVSRVVTFLWQNKTAIIVTNLKHISFVQKLDNPNI